MSPADHALGARFAAMSTRVSPYPPSFDNNPVLYAWSLGSLLCISILCAILLGWMVRDLWRDRMRDHPLSLPFLFRLMFALIPSVGLLRPLPEVVMLTCWGEVTGATMGRILAFKRFTDTLALPDVILWQGIFLLTYPHIMLQLTTSQARRAPILDPLSLWPRLGRAFLTVALVAFISALMAWGKWQMSRHGG